MGGEEKSAALSRQTGFENAQVVEDTSQPFLAHTGNVTAASSIENDTSVFVRRRNSLLASAHANRNCVDC
jgi:hypothetical protein